MNISPSDRRLNAVLKKVLEPFKQGVKRKASGKLPFDYLVPSGVYEEQWDWDAFFMGMALSQKNPKEAVYLKNWVLNFVVNSFPDGYTPGCITPKGRDTRLHQMKPFLAQGAYFASRFLKDFSWMAPYLAQMKNILLYREKHLWNKTYDLGVWFNSMESGADNNAAALEYADKSVVATDLNTYIYREYLSFSLILKRLKREQEAKQFARRAEEIKNAINSFLWDEEDGAYYNTYARTKTHIKKISYNSMHPLWAGIAPKKRAIRFIKTYVLNPKKLWSPFGIRTLSKDDSFYNNKNIIKPYSNWQGPVWPLFNYFSLYSLFNYGFKKEALEVARKTIELCIADIKNSGGMHENYNAETGKPLAAPHFISWNLLVYNMFDDIESGRNPFKLP